MLLPSMQMVNVFYKIEHFLKLIFGDKYYLFCEKKDGLISE